MVQGKQAWQCIRDLHYGLTPSRVVTIMNENGYLCSSSQAQQQRWRRHFRNVLNAHNIVDMEEQIVVEGGTIDSVDESSSGSINREVDKCITNKHRRDGTLAYMAK